MGYVLYIAVTRLTVPAVCLLRVGCQGKTFLRQVSPMDFVVYLAVVVISDLHPVCARTDEARAREFSSD